MTQIAVIKEGLVFPGHTYRPQPKKDFTLEHFATLLEPTKYLRQNPDAKPIREITPKDLLEERVIFSEVIDSSTTEFSGPECWGDFGLSAEYWTQFGVSHKMKKIIDNAVRTIKSGTLAITSSEVMSHQPQFVGGFYEENTGNLYTVTAKGIILPKL